MSQNSIYRGFTQLDFFECNETKKRPSRVDPVRLFKSVKKTGASSQQLEIYIDGASSGNPGPAGVGIVFIKNSKAFKDVAVHLGVQTNNFAEYMGLIFALQEAILLKADNLKIYTDSQLLCRQVNGQYKIKSPNLIGLYNQVCRLLPAFKSVEIEHIPRDRNKAADKLAKNAAENKNCTQVQVAALQQNCREESPDSGGQRGC